jgi:hypothetical protein
MYSINGSEAFHQLYDNIRKKTHQIPPKSDKVQQNGSCLLPKVFPKFHITPGQKIFTIGSCFARNVEKELIDAGYKVPVAGFKLNANELGHPDPHALNEYNAGTLIQRLENLTGVRPYTDEMGLELSEKGYRDLFLHYQCEPVTLERLLERRKQIDELYQEIMDSDVVIITLGLIECWYDSKFDCYLNAAPSLTFLNENPGRFFFRRMDLEDVMPRLSKVVEVLKDKNILITVSPIPLEATFMPQHAVLSNCYSKSVLRVCSEMLYTKYPNVDYFPSYEIVMSGGVHVFVENNVHVQDIAIKSIMKHLMSNYQKDAVKYT